MMLKIPSALLCMISLSFWRDNLCPIAAQIKSLSKGDGGFLSLFQCYAINSGRDLRNDIMPVAGILAHWFFWCFIYGFDLSIVGECIINTLSSQFEFMLISLI